MQKNISVNFQELSTEHLIKGEPYLLNVRYKEINFEFFLKFNGSQTLLCLGNGAYDYNQSSLPIFQRCTWANEIESSLIIYNDPTLYLDKIYIGWCQGTENHFYIESIGEILTKIHTLLNINRKNIVFYGSSAGGFTSLYLAGLIQGTRALVNNPQTNVFKFYKSRVDQMLGVSYKNVNESTILKLYLKRLSVIELYKHLNYVPEILYMQNIACSHDVENQLAPFINYIKSCDKKFRDKVSVDYYYNEKEGHNPISKKETLKIINRFVKSSNENEEKFNWK